MIAATLALSPEAVEQIAGRVAELIGTPPVEDRWMDAKDAAEYLAIPLSTLHKLTAADAIPHSQDCPGGKLYFKRSDLDKWRQGG